MGHQRVGYARSYHPAWRDVYKLLIMKQADAINQPVSCTYQELCVLMRVAIVDCFGKAYELFSDPHFMCPVISLGSCPRQC